MELTSSKMNDRLIDNYSPINTEVHSQEDHLSLSKPNNDTDNSLRNTNNPREITVIISPDMQPPTAPPMSAIVRPQNGNSQIAVANQTVSVTKRFFATIAVALAFDTVGYLYMGNGDTTYYLTFTGIGITLFAALYFYRFCHLIGDGG